MKFATLLVSLFLFIGCNEKTPESVPPDPVPEDPSTPTDPTPEVGKTKKPAKAPCVRLDEAVVKRTARAFRPDMPNVVETTFELTDEESERLLNDRIRKIGDREITLRDYFDAVARGDHKFIEEISIKPQPVERRDNEPQPSGGSDYVRSIRCNGMTYTNANGLNLYSFNWRFENKGTARALDGPPTDLEQPTLPRPSNKTKLVCSVDSDCGLTSVRDQSGAKFDCCHSCSKQAVSKKWLRVFQSYCKVEKRNCPRKKCAKPKPVKAVCENNTCMTKPL